MERPVRRRRRTKLKYVDPCQLEMSDEVNPLKERDDDYAQKYDLYREYFKQRIKPDIKPIIDETLTPRQYEVCTYYYSGNKSQNEIADILNVSQSTVSQHLIGKVRRGNTIGGAIRKVKKALLRKALKDAFLRHKNDVEDFMAFLDKLITRPHFHFLMKNWFNKTPHVFQKKVPISTR